MKTIFKYLVLTSLNILLYLFLVMPANAQRGGGGGGGHSGGGGGGHVGGGGGHFGGGGAHFGGGSFSGSVHSSGFAGRSNFSPRVGSVQSRPGFGVNSRAVGVRTSHGYVRGNGPGAYGHGGQYGHYRWGRHGGYFYNGGFYSSLYYPWLGFDCWFLPYGYDMFYWNDYPYYFSDGLYYQYDNDEYTVVEPPVGASIKTLPSKAQSIIIDGKQYYELKGIYYLPVTKDDGTVVYQIAGKDGELNTEADGATSIVPKIGDIVAKLPEDCRKITLNNQTLFVSEDGIYYQETKDSNNKTVYKIVGLEDEVTGN